MPATVLFPLQVKIHPIFKIVPKGRYSRQPHLIKMKTVRQGGRGQATNCPRPQSLSEGSIRSEPRQRAGLGACAAALSLTEQLGAQRRSWRGTRGGVGQAGGANSALLDMFTLRFLVDIQVEMLGRRLACLDLRGKVGMEV